MRHRSLSERQQLGFGVHEFVGILLLWPNSFCRTSSAIESPTTAGPLRVGPPFAPDSLLEP